MQPSYRTHFGVGGVSQLETDLPEMLKARYTWVTSTPSAIGSPMLMRFSANA